ncbi:hypothetical protein AB6A40_009175 [Gnathostoma spinigerum]|uniref:tRNA (guanine(26)-N(2))-dimethyltransferase n=1 Tax=Gnathostoma spinigerum TaxID=75299 RepID=A0ABD6EYB6_9BILA
MTDTKESPSDHEVTTITEGSAKITFIGRSSAFYNPVQEFNRDLTITVLQQFSDDWKKEFETEDKDGISAEGSPSRKRPRVYDSLGDGQIKVLDALSASGLRALRFAKEVPNISKIIANDFCEQAVETIKRNIQLNKVENIVEARYGDATETMMQHRSLDKRFHAIDLDPYGSVSVFLDSAVQSIADRGILMITCTDMAVLCGNTPESCYNKYGSVSLRTKSCHEMALRILLRTVDSHANRYARYIEPLLSISIDFYIRVFVRVHTSAKIAKDSILKTSNIFVCSGCHTFSFQTLARKVTVDNSVKFTCSTANLPTLTDGGKCTFCAQSVHIAGPIYSAPIHNFSFVKKLLERLKNNKESTALKTQKRLIGVLSVVSEELPDVPLYYELDELCHVLKCPVPRLLAFHSSIFNAGYRCSISHCNPRAVKTDAPPDLLWDTVRTLARSNGVKIEKFSEGSPGWRILSTEIKNNISFKMHPLAQAKSRVECAVRFQSNKGRNWGPKQKARGSVNSVKAGFQFQDLKAEESK